MMRATPESPRMFESNFLDFFSRVAWWVVPMIYVPVIVGMLIAGFMAGASPLWIPVQFALGLVIWTLTEYWLHRTLFHWIPNDGWGAKMHFYIHGVHHDLPKDRYRLVMPPAASVALGVIFFSAYYGISMVLSPWINPTWVWALFAGKIAGYLYYDMVHYYVHHNRPRLRYFKKLKAHHMNHHHNKEERKFGVSMMLWDHVFSTYE